MLASRLRDLNIVMVEIFLYSSNLFRNNFLKDNYMKNNWSIFSYYDIVYLYKNKMFLTMVYVLICQNNFQMVLDLIFIARNAMKNKT